MSREFCTGRARTENQGKFEVYVCTAGSILTAIECTLSCWRKHHQDATLVTGTSVVQHPKLALQIPSDQRSSYDVILKVFAKPDCSPDDVFRSIQIGKRTVEIDLFDQTVLSEFANSHDSATYRRQWTGVERALNDHLTAKIGTSDINAFQLADFLQAVKVPPSILQVSAHLPSASLKDIGKRASSHSIDVRLHGDGSFPDTFERDINTQIRKTFGEIETPAFKVAWIARITAIDKTRSVIEHISYIVQLAVE